MITLEEAKSYLRVDFDDEDEMIESLIQSSIKHSMDVARVDSEEDLSKNPNGKIAVLYMTAYLYEHREEADYSKLNSKGFIIWNEKG